MKILIIAAHPDDEVLGAGGTIAKLCRNGNEVYVLIITEGCTSQYKDKPELVEQKKNQALNANSVLGVKEVFFGNLPDMKLDRVSHIDINKIIEDTIDKIKPEVVYTHFYGDINKDHQYVFESTLVAVRPVFSQCVKELYCYQVPSSTEWGANLSHNIFIPNVIEEISSVYDIKQKALMQYESELREYPHPRCLEVIKMYDETLAKKNGLNLSEGFILIRKLNV